MNVKFPPPPTVADPALKNWIEQMHALLVFYVTKARNESEVVTIIGDTLLAGTNITITEGTDGDLTIASSYADFTDMAMYG